MPGYPKILTVNVSDTSGGAARAAYRIHSAVNSAGGNSRMFVKNKHTTEDSILTSDQFDRPSFIKNIWRFVNNKLQNKWQHFQWNQYPKRDDVFLSDLRSSSIHQAFRKIDFDILHLHWINLRFLNLAELRKANKPIIWTLHDCWPFTGICHYFYDCTKYTSGCCICPFLHSNKEHDLSWHTWKRKKQFYQGLDLHIVTPSHWLANAARNSILFGSFPVTVIPNPIDTNLFSPGDKNESCNRLCIESNKTYILYSAMNALSDKNKGFSKLVEAFKFLETKQHAQQIELLVTGADQPLQELSMQIPIHYLGIISNDDQMVAAYRASSVMVLPSLSENLSYAIMESLACGTPAVAFNTGGNGELIDHKQNGYLAEAFLPESLAEGIEWCLNHNERYHLSSNARQTITSTCKPDIVSAKYIELYKSIQYKSSCK